MSYQRTGSLRRVMDRNRRMQAVAKERPSSMDQKGGGARLVASMPTSVVSEMLQTYGPGADDQRAFLRDHPQYATVPRSQIVAPPKRAAFVMGCRVTDNEWARIFPPERKSR